jgi:hypothetical protein
MRDPHTKESRGFGFVKMVTPDGARAAKDGLSGETHNGRTLSIEMARRDRPRTPTPGKYYGPPKRGKYWIKLIGSGRSQTVQMISVVVAAVEDGMVTVVTVTAIAMEIVTTTEATDVVMIIMADDEVMEEAEIATMTVATTAVAVGNGAETIMATHPEASIDMVVEAEVADVKIAMAAVEMTVVEVAVATMSVSRAVLLHLLQEAMRQAVKIVVPAPTTTVVITAESYCRISANMIRSRA